MSVTVRFRERMCGPMRPVGATPWWIGPRGPRAADGVPAFVDLVTGGLQLPASRPVLDLDAIEVEIRGTDRDDGFRADVLRGVVRGVTDDPLPVVAGYADILTRSSVAGPDGSRSAVAVPDGSRSAVAVPNGSPPAAATGHSSAAARRTMHYRLLVRSGRSSRRSGQTDAWWIVEGVKTVHGGLRDVHRATTTLATIVVRLPDGAVDEDSAGDLLVTGGVTGTVVSAGTLRVRGLLRQGLSMRGDVLSFLVGFAARALTTRPVGRGDRAARRTVTAVRPRTR